MMTGGGPFHLVGIGGIGMSAIAKLLHQQGCAISGSDIQSSPTVEALKSLGIRVELGHALAHIGNARCVVYSSSIAPDNPELVEAGVRGLKVMHRSEALAQLSEDHFVIAVCGTHGKTTTTTLLGRIFEKAGRDPTVVVGAKVPEWNGNLLRGWGGIMIIEADESDASFLRYSPDVVLMTNIDSDHLDYFKSLRHIEECFERFTARLKPGGFWCGSIACPRVRELAGRSSVKALRYGWGQEADYFARHMRSLGPGGSRFILGGPQGDWGEIHLSLVGSHNVLNAVGASAVALALGLGFEDIQEALEGFKGAARRFDVLHRDQYLIVVDDYAHHPTEIRETLKAAKSFSQLRLVVFFEPHRFSRTHLLEEEFLNCFEESDELYITDIYPAGEVPLRGVTGEGLAGKIHRFSRREVKYVPRAGLLEAMVSRSREGGMIMSMGAGAIGEVAHRLVSRLKETVDELREGQR